MIENRLRTRRQAAGLSQGDLAARAGVTRQTIGALESGQGTPGLAVALRLARALDLEVDDLFWLDDAVQTIEAELPAGVTPGDSRRVQLARVGGRLLARPLDAFSVADGLLPATATPAGRVVVSLLTDPATLDRTAVVLGCDPALQLLGAHLQRRHARQGLRLAIGQAGSMAALDALARGEAHVAGMHLRDAATGDYNLPFVRRALAGQRVLVVTAVHWRQGLLLARGNPHGIGSVADLARPEISIVNREPGAGSRAALDQALRAAGVSGAHVRGYDRAVRSHRAIAEVVAAGLAAAGPGIEAAARALDLDFLPLAHERYDLVIAGAARESAPVAALLATLTSRAFRDEVSALPGYDLSQTGTTLLDETLLAS